MPQAFPRYANAVARGCVVGVPLLFLLLVAAGYYAQRSPHYTFEGKYVEQPVAFSHQHHVGGLGIDCRYCHTGTEQSHFAGLPPTSTCMSCHSQLYTDSETLAPVRQSWTSGEPVAWNRVYKIPEYAYFNHSAHTNNGISCVSCHGNVSEQPLVYKAAPLTMGWCLECHRNPEKYVVPPDQIYNPATVPPGGEEGRKLVDFYHIPLDGRLSNCSICHR